MLKNLPGAAWTFSPAQIAEAKKRGGILNCDIEISKHCNLNCVFCYSESGPGNRDELTIKEIFSTISEAKKLGVQTVTLTGGEPLLRSEFFTIVDFITSNELRCLFFTNGTLISHNIAQKLFDYQVLPCVSIESVDPHIHDEMVKCSGAHNKTLAGIQNLIDVGYTDALPLTINAVISTINRETLPLLWDWATSRNIDPFLLRLISSGRGGNIRDLQVSPLELKTLVDDISLKADFPPVLPFLGNSGCKKHGISCYIDAYGYVKPCSCLDITCGNIKLRSLSEILKSSPIFSLMKNIQDNIQGECKECEHHEVCYGCRAITYSLTGDLVGSDPLCWHVNA